MIAQLAVWLFAVVGVVWFTRWLFDGCERFADRREDES